MSQEYEVQKIVDSRIQNGKQLFKVKWKGYSLSDCTWQPEENLTNCLLEMEEFRRKRRASILKQPMSFKQRYPNTKIDSPDEESDEKGGIVPKNTAKDGNKFTYEQQMSEQQNQENNLQKYIIQPKKMVSSKIVITKMLRDDQDNIFFEAALEDRVETFSRSELIKTNLLELLEFYERSIRIKSRNQ